MPETGGSASKRVKHVSGKCQRFSRQIGKSNGRRPHFSAFESLARDSTSHGAATERAASSNLGEPLNHFAFVPPSFVLLGLKRIEVHVGKATLVQLPAINHRYVSSLLAFAFSSSLYGDFLFYRRIFHREKSNFASSFGHRSRFMVENPRQRCSRLFDSELPSFPSPGKTKIVEPRSAKRL